MGIDTNVKKRSTDPALAKRIVDALAHRRDCPACGQALKPVAVYGLGCRGCAMQDGKPHLRIHWYTEEHALVPAYEKIIGQRPSAQEIVDFVADVGGAIIPLSPEHVRQMLGTYGQRNSPESK